MNEQEKKAIKYMKEFQKDLYGASSKNLMDSYLDTIFNLIDKQQKEIKELKKENNQCKKYIEKEIIRSNDKKYFRNFGDLSGDSVATDIYIKRQKRRWKK